MAERFISFAQNFEDVILWRALGSITDGFYIDVGANHPVNDSVTKAFYERGWRGINVEPVSRFHELLAADRCRDINLRCAVASRPGLLRFYEVTDSGLSTLDPTIAERHREAGFEVRELDVPTKPLWEICEEHSVTEVHFLKVDVEGAEEEVLQSMRFDRVRPWICLVEATWPNTQNPSYQRWEPLLLAQGYEYVYFDGASRYYLSKEHLELAPALRVPPNAFDNFVQYPFWLCQQDNMALRRELTAVQKRIGEIRASWSWRLTKPLRALALARDWIFRRPRVD